MESFSNECGVCASEYVVAYCENCNFKICETCFQMHKKSTKLFKNHVAFLIENSTTITDPNTSSDDARDVSKESSGDIHAQKCATHRTENLVFFCTDHTETLCGRCVFSSHKSCKVVDLFEVNFDDEEVSACRSHLKRIFEVLKSTENKIEKNANENNACKIEFLKDLGHLRTYVINWFDRLQSKCEKKCHETFETNAERFTQVRTFCQAHTKRIQECQELIDNLLTQNHVKKLFVLLNTSKQELAEIESKLNWLAGESTFNSYIFKRSKGIETILNDHALKIGSLEEWCSGSDEILDETASSLKVLLLEPMAERSLSELLPNSCDIGDCGKRREEDVLNTSKDPTDSSTILDSCSTKGKDYMTLHSEDSAPDRAPNVFTRGIIEKHKTPIHVVSFDEVHDVSVEKSSSWNPVMPQQNNRCNTFEASACFNTDMTDYIAEQNLLQEWEETLKVPMNELHYKYICFLRNNNLIGTSVSSIQFLSGFLEAKGFKKDLLTLKYEVDEILAIATQEHITFNTDEEAKQAINKHLNTFLDIYITREDNTIRIVGSPKNVVKAWNSLVPIPWTTLYAEPPNRKLKFEVQHGDIRNAVAEFIVVSSTARMSYPVGASRQIRDMLGEGYIQECRLSIMNEGEIRPGDCRVIKSGLHVRKWIGHVVERVRRDRQARESMADTFDECLFEADRKQCETMAMTCIFSDTSRGGFGLRECVQCLLESIETFEAKHLRKITLVEKNGDKVEELWALIQTNTMWKCYIYN